MAGEPIFGLSAADVAELRLLVQERRQRVRNPQGRPAVVSEEITAPEVYVARVPPGGIAGIIDANLSSVECDVYRRLPNGDDLVPAGFTKDVYNLSPFAVRGRQFVPVARDKFGTWYVTASCTDCGDDANTGTGTETFTGTGTGTGGAVVESACCSGVQLPETLYATCVLNPGECSNLPTTIEFSYVADYNTGLGEPVLDAIFGYWRSPDFEAASPGSGTHHFRVVCVVPELGVEGMLLYNYCASGPHLTEVSVVGTPPESTCNPLLLNYGLISSGIWCCGSGQMSIIITE